MYTKHKDFDEPDNYEGHSATKFHECLGFIHEVRAVMLLSLKTPSDEKFLASLPAWVYGKSACYSKIMSHEKSPRIRTP